MRKIRGILLLTACICSVAVISEAADKIRLAVVDFAPLNTKEEYSQPLTEAFRRELAKKSNLEVLSRDKIETVFEKIDPLLNLKLNQTDCTNATCAVRVGRDLLADGTIIGNINFKGGVYVITAQLIDLEKRDTEYMTSEETSDEKNLAEAAKKLGQKMAEIMPNPGEKPEQVKQRRIEQQRKEQAAKDKAIEDQRKKLAERKPGTCPEGMVLIAAGEYTNAAGKKVKVAEYCIDKYEFPNKKGARPTSKIEWFGAKEECEKQGKHLCSENEWETACGGAQGNNYPYGKDYNPSKCNTADRSPEEKKIMASGECAECVSSFGVADMSGNVAEWTGDWDDPDIKTVVIKGGSFQGKAKNTGCSSRQSSMVFSRGADMGFRCCK